MEEVESPREKGEEKRKSVFCSLPSFPWAEPQAPGWVWRSWRTSGFVAHFHGGSPGRLPDGVAR